MLVFGTIMRNDLILYSSISEPIEYLETILDTVYYQHLHLPGFTIIKISFFLFFYYQTL